MERVSTVNFPGERGRPACPRHAAGNSMSIFRGRGDVRIRRSAERWHWRPTLVALASVSRRLSSCCPLSPKSLPPKNFVFRKRDLGNDLGVSCPLSPKSLPVKNFVFRKGDLGNDLGERVRVRGPGAPLACPLTLALSPRKLTGRACLAWSAFLPSIFRGRGDVRLAPVTQQGTRCQFSGGEGTSESAGRRSGGIGDQRLSLWLMFHVGCPAAVPSPPNRCRRKTSCSEKATSATRVWGLPVPSPPNRCREKLRVQKRRSSATIWGRGLG
jgi:hypothetical protein